MNDMTPEALSYCLSRVASGNSSSGHADALRAHIELLEADIAEMKGLIQMALRYVQAHPGSAKERLAMLVLATSDRHPGSSLLEDHRKALVRAKNEGRELAALRIECGCSELCTRNRHAAEIRSSKEPE